MSLDAERRKPARMSRGRKVLILVLIAVVTFGLGWLIQSVLAPILIEPPSPWNVAPPGPGR